ncbi:AfsR/SARP family transcriptional regulator [Streptomyces sp. NPDC006645]|uniref:AfsR/SARP family transcriptional regulator n=1 Tax=unclassified Streptomyces TaxID=2593676 RepID=UPI0033A34D8E
MQFNLIGSFEIVNDDGRTHAPKAPKICQILAALALQPRETVATDSLVGELWGQDAPNNATRTLQTHVYHARRMFDDAQTDTAARRLLLTRPPGYCLDLADDEVDVYVFEHHVRRAQGALTEGRPERAAEHLDRAQALWRGNFLGNLPVGPLLAGRMAHLEELRIRALELRVETENRLGRHRDFLPELRALVNDHPLHEWFHGQLISSLHRVGRRGEALQAYQDLYRILKRELGLEPSEEIKRLQAEILQTDTNPLLKLRLHNNSAPRSATALWASSVAT